MAFEGLSDKLSAAFKRLRSKGKLTEADVKEAMREVRLALLEADVNYKVAKDFTAAVTARAVGAQVMESLTPAQMVIKIVNEELTSLMGGEAVRLASANHPPCAVMMCGLQGSGKTTHSAKLARMLKSQGHRPLLVACDVYRPAAITQLQVVGERAGVPVFEMGTANPVDIARKAMAHAKDHGNDYVLLDTAGRLHIDEQLMDELKNIKAAVEPQEILLVVDAMTGQDAVNVAAAFNEALGIDGVILTKLDGDTRGGAALSASRSSSPAPAKNWRILRSSTPNAWPPVSLAWAMCCHSSKRQSSSSTPRRRKKSPARCSRINLISTICSTSSTRCAEWAISKECWVCCRESANSCRTSISTSGSSTGLRRSSFP